MDGYYSKGYCRSPSAATWLGRPRFIGKSLRRLFFSLCCTRGSAWWTRQQQIINARRDERTTTQQPSQVSIVLCVIVIGAASWQEDELLKNPPHHQQHHHHHQIKCSLLDFVFIVPLFIFLQNFVFQFLWPRSLLCHYYYYYYCYVVLSRLDVIFPDENLYAQPWVNS